MIRPEETSRMHNVNVDALKQTIAKAREHR